MRRWSGRPETPAQFDLNRIRMIGEWGRASRYVGARWEEIGLDLLRAGVAGRSPVALLAVYAEPELARLLASTGSKNPDVVLSFAVEGALVLQPADLKWSLDVASYRQISAAVLAILLAQVPRLSEALRALLPPDLQAHEWTAKDGFFFSPRTFANERFLTSPENKRQEYPLEPVEVLFETVDAYDFFEPLPGWATARELARMDGSARGLGQIDSADRYYHLGAGVAGALVTLDGSIFDDEQPIEPAEEVPRLRAFLGTLSPPSTGAAIEHLGTWMRQRNEVTRRFRDLTRASFSFRDFAGQLVVAGLATPEDSERDLRRRWSQTYRDLIDTAEAELRQAGRELRAKGASDVVALDTLERQREVYERRLRGRAQLAIRAAALARVDPDEPD